MNKKSTLRDVLLNAGTTDEGYAHVKAAITESNRERLTAFSSIAAAAFAVMTLWSFRADLLAKNRSVYLAMLLLSLLHYFLAAVPAKYSRTLTDILLYTFLGSFFAFGVVLGTVTAPEVPTVSFIILLFGIQFLFTGRPIRIILYSFLWLLIYFAAAFCLQPRDIFLYNVQNILPYGIIGMIIGTHLMKMKVGWFVLNRERESLLEIDQLTGLRNRRAYEEHLQELRDRGLTGKEKICAMDVNGLKTVNDTLGHQAGDELLAGAADCIRRVFGTLGDCYRIGGDEFAVILDDATGWTEKVLEGRLQEEASIWKGGKSSGLSISIGTASAEAGGNVNQLMQKADEAMYRAKRMYYGDHNQNRRRGGESAG